MSFKKNKYCVVKKAIPNNLAEFLTKYFLLKRKVARKLFDSTYISEFTPEWGIWNDAQAPDTYSHYADIAMETLLDSLKPLMEKETNLELVPTYSYARIYKTGDILKRHIDRESCEISTTLNLGGDHWDIYLEPSGKKNMKGIKINLNQGDMLIYKGCDLEHWGNAFNGLYCVQVFLHYNRKTKDSNNNEFDSRPHLGLPAWFKK